MVDEPEVPAHPDHGLAASLGPDAPDPAPDEHGGLLDRVEDAVEELLGEDLVAPQDEDPWERRARKLDAWTAIVLGVAAVATAWATFQSSQWSEAQAQAQFEAATLRTDAGRAAAEGTSERVVDSQMWLHWLAARGERETVEAKFYEDRFSPALEKAHKEWLSLTPDPLAINADTAAEGTPMDLDSYLPPAQARSDRLADEAEDLVAQAGEANSTATRFVLTALIIALSLFFAGIATKFTSPKVQTALLAAAIVILAFSGIRMFLLPQLLW